MPLEFDNNLKAQPTIEVGDTVNTMFSGTAVVLAVDGDSVWVKDADGTRFTQNASSVTVKPWVIEVGTVANLQWATLPVEVLFIRGDEAAVAYLEQDLPSSEMFVVQLEELLKP